MTSKERQDELLSAWMEGPISAADEMELRTFAEHDDELARIMAMSEELQNRASNYDLQQVPEWDRNRTWRPPESQSRWSFKGLSLASMAMSLCAMIMVLSNFHIELSDQQLKFGFGSEADSQQELDIKLAEIKAEQDKKLYELARELKIQQLEANAKLVDYVLTSNRESREQEISSLISYLEKQRKSDFNYINSELAKVRFKRYD